MKRQSIALCALVVLCSASPAPGQSPGRPLIIFVHGRGQEHVSRDTIVATWTEAFDKGLKAAGATESDVAPDLRFIYYGDVFTHQYAPSATCFRVANHVRDALASHAEVELGNLEDLRATKPPRPSVLDRVKDFLVKQAVALHGSTALAISLMDDTRTYFGRGEEFCDTNRRLVSALDTAEQSQRPVVLVAHSMGSLVAFTVLNGEDVGGSPPRPISGFVSFGSQLGVRDLLPYVFGAGVTIPAPIPRSVREWYNARGTADYLGFKAHPVYQVGTSSPTDRALVKLCGNARQAASFSLAGLATRIPSWYSVPA